MKIMHYPFIATLLLCLFVSSCQKNDAQKPELTPGDKLVATASTMSCCEISIQVNNESVSFNTPSGSFELPSMLFDLSNLELDYNSSCCIKTCSPPDPVDIPKQQSWQERAEAMLDAFRAISETPPPCPISPKTYFEAQEVEYANYAEISFEGTARHAAETFNRLVTPSTGPRIPGIEDYAGLAVYLNGLTGKLFTRCDAYEGFGAATSGSLVIAVYVDLGEAETGIDRSRAAVLMPGYDNRELLSWPDGSTYEVPRPANVYSASEFFSDDAIMASTVYFIYTPYLCY